MCSRLTSFLRVPILMEYDDYKKLQINAATDALTGLYNRRLFDEYFDKELNRAKRYGQHLAVVILDLHKLKEVNDRVGHLQGDQVLQLAAATLRKTLRASDFAFRIGGDEFALLLPQTDPEQAVTLCRRIRAQYEGEIAPLNLPIGVTIDFGVAVFPQDGDEKTALLDLADKKTLRAQEFEAAGRRGCRLWSRRKPLLAKPLPRFRSGGDRPALHLFRVPAPEPMPNRGRGARVTGTEQRKWERVSLSGTKAHAILTELGQRTAKVIRFELRRSLAFA